MTVLAVEFLLVLLNGCPLDFTRLLLELVFNLLELVSLLLALCLQFLDLLFSEDMLILVVLDPRELGPHLIGHAGTP